MVPAMVHMSPRWFFGLTILAVGAACASDGITGLLGFDHAVVTPACGPADGPAVAIILAHNPVDPRNPPIPSIRIGVSQARDVVGGRTWGVGGAGDSAWAVLATGNNHYEASVGGHFTIAVIDTTSTTDGSAELVFPTIGVVSGDFSAAWRPATQMCG